MAFLGVTPSCWVCVIYRNEIYLNICGGQRKSLKKGRPYQKLWYVEYLVLIRKSRPSLLFRCFISSMSLHQHKYEKRINISQSNQKLQYSKDNVFQRECIRKLYLQFEKVPLFPGAHILLWLKTFKKCLENLLAYMNMNMNM